MQAGRHVVLRLSSNVRSSVFCVGWKREAKNIKKLTGQSVLEEK